MPKRYYFHASSPENRESILRGGLRKGGWASFGPPAIYLFKYQMFAEDYIPEEPMDIWKVDAKGLTVYPDPEDPDASCYSLNPISKGALKRIGTVLRGNLLPKDWRG